LALPLVPAGIVAAGTMKVMASGLYESWVSAAAAVAVTWVVFFALLLAGAKLWDRYGGL
jgi:hypothetical protein